MKHLPKKILAQHMLLILSLGWAPTCTTPPAEDNAILLANKNDRQLPPVFRRMGLISSSTYQVHVAIVAQSETEARSQGEQAARELAYKLISEKEHFMRKYLSYRSQETLRGLIAEKGKVVRIFRQSLDGEQIQSWIVVFQINKIGLRSFIKELR